MNSFSRNYSFLKVENEAGRPDWPGGQMAGPGRPDWLGGQTGWEVAGRPDWIIPYPPLSQ